jgi:hypothetical protein
MPGFNINGEGGGPDPKTDTLRSHRFTLITFMGSSGKDKPYDLLKDVDLPDRIIDELQIKTPGATYKFAKSANYGDLKMIFYVPKDLLSKLEKLQDKVHTSKQGIGDFGDYTDEISFSFDDEKGKALDTFKFKNCWISNLVPNQASYGSSEILVVTVTIKFSWYEIS